MTDELTGTEEEPATDARSLDSPSRVALGVGGVTLGFIIVGTLHGVHIAVAMLGIGVLRAPTLTNNDVLALFVMSPMFIGCTQVAYVLPLVSPCILVPRLRMLGAGMLLAAGITFLLNSACWGLVLAASLSG